MEVIEKMGVVTFLCLMKEENEVTYSSDARRIPNVN